MKTIVTLLIIALTLPIASLYAQGEPCDFNQNGFADAADMARMINYLECNIIVDTLPAYWPMGDCDQDSVSLTLADELSLSIRLIHGYGYGRGIRVESSIDTMSIPNAVASPGQSVTLPIHIRTERQLNGVQFFLHYDPNLLTITDFFMPDTLPANPFDNACNFDNGISNSAMLYPNAGIFHDPLIFMNVIVNPNAPVGSDVIIEFADYPQRAVYTYLSFIDTLAVPPDPDIQNIKPVFVNGLIDIVQTGISNGESTANDGLSLDIWANPGNLSYLIRFHNPQNSYIKLDLFDVLGRCVANLINSQYPAGDHEITWNGQVTSSGVYFIRLSSDDEHITRKLTLLK